MRGFDYEDEDQEKAEWENLKYVSKDCPKCGRQRFELCVNQKHWCEKCFLVVEDAKYFKPDWKI